MSNVLNVNRTSAKQPKVKSLTPRPAQPRPQRIRLATRDPRRKRG
jgi:hypothetical protein